MLSLWNLFMLLLMLHLLVWSFLMMEWFRQYLLFLRLMFLDMLLTLLLEYLRSVELLGTHVSLENWLLLLAFGVESPPGLLILSAHL